MMSNESVARIRILLIDDDPQFRNLIVAFLRRDYLVSVAATGNEGYQKALEHTPDIALIDIQMPEWDGLETLRAFRKRPALQRVRIVMLTADTSRQTVMEAITLGADDYIVKTSLTKDDLLTKLQRVRKLLPAAPSSSSGTPAPVSVPLTSAVTPLGSAASGHEPITPTIDTSLNGTAKTAEESGEHPVLNPKSSTPAGDDPRLQELLDAWE